MTTKSKAVEKAEVAAGAAEVSPAAPAEDAPAVAVRPAGRCVVDDGTPHVGRAVNGVVCSAHAMNYRADGTRR